MCTKYIVALGLTDTADSGRVGVVVGASRTGPSLFLYEIANL